MRYRALFSKKGYEKEGPTAARERVYDGVYKNRLPDVRRSPGRLDEATGSDEQIRKRRNYLRYHFSKPQVLTRQVCRSVPRWGKMSASQKQIFHKQGCDELASTVMDKDQKLLFLRE